MNGHSVAHAIRSRNAHAVRLVERPAAAPQLDPFALAERAHARKEPFFLWQSADRSRTLLGVGEVLRLTSQGSGRFGEIDAAWRALDCSEATDALLLGGFAFFDAAQPGSRRAADFFVPQVLVDREGTIARTLLFTRKEGAGQAEYSDAQRLLDALREGVPSRVVPLQVFDPPGARRAFKARVLAATEEIARGDLEKVVLARTRFVRYPEFPSIAAVLRTLSAREADCRVFAYGDGRSVFLGATPELLCLCQDGTARVDCLAGSAPRGADPASDAAIGLSLLGSQKNLHEHRCVVDAVRGALEGLGLSASAPPAPRLRRLANVQHLYTPVRAQLDGQGILPLAQALHPTPAVGGSPREPALRWIAAHEGGARGLFAGAVGFVDARGDGELDVGLRSALLRPHGARLYAGCGIVRGSDPDEEFKESEVKMRPMMNALRGGR